ncbi:ferredoxin-NADP reductase/MOSC domain-containing protein YiiM/ferredoxin [Bradyrhizobium japonicum]|jgi:ferredoxin-NADP reductase/MOSC domain-containing protein YiiM/ferredoxin|uniref:MOSC and FAD-binding oxidoreductase domain-containing protein n=1 Tax=Bradyrhizobium TaxID=374 RepID=UPI0004AE6294|nr:MULTISPECIES: MOSC and FAD-binding oxidoreductase domain-containing protein [Bradyrhizobium]MDI2074610.1 MOSC and FAD-binding oxidoreductase domain-containing protein [Bradyrhizobium sp. Mp27]
MTRLLSLNVGLPRDIAWQGRTVHTGIWKAPVSGPRRVRRLNIDGDGQGDTAGHGGEQRAVYVYQQDSYQYWQEHLGRANLVHGQFGENFTVEGLADKDVRIGDRYKIGTALFEVTQPRVTCYRLGIRMEEPDMAALLVRHGRPGFYFRVIEEGDVEAGDEIVRVADGPEHMSVSEINALLYLPPHPRDRLERALKIPALSGGWRHSFEALLEQHRKDTAAGNAGLGPASSPPPAWRGFRPFRVARKIAESGNVTSLILEPTDGHPVAAALPGQFVIVRLGASTAPAMTRSYSLSSCSDAASWRISIKRETHGAASQYVADEVKIGDAVQIGAPRGSFTLRQYPRPVVLLSAGIGVTPVLAMLHALAAEASTREVWWLHGARNGREHAFAAEVRGLLAGLAHHHSHVCYSAPDPGDRLDVDFDSIGHLDLRVLQTLGVPSDGDFYLCGPAPFMTDLSRGLTAFGVAPDRVHTEMFGAGPPLTPGIAASPQTRAHLPAGTTGPGPMVSFARSGLNVCWGPSYASLLELAEACDVPVRWSCRTGVCHNCESGLVAGSVSYAPDPLDAPADGNVLICCSRPQGDVVIDL